MASIRSRRRPIGVGRYREVLEIFLGLNSNAHRSWRATGCQCRWNSSDRGRPSHPEIVIDEIAHSRDEWTNVTPSIISSLGSKLHLQESHPICLTRQIIESKFPPSTYTTYNLFSPVVSTYDNFDSLGFPKDHPGRSKSDTYYINKETVLRTHTSAHQVKVFRANASPGFLISADVYRRDAIDRSHYPIFHQMEGARTWDRYKVPGGDIVAAINSELAHIPKVPFDVQDRRPPFHPWTNPLQVGRHRPEEAAAVAAHLKRTLEIVVLDIFSRARAAALLNDPNFKDEPLKVRWVEAYFPFTSPSYELEIFWQGEWLEVLGCGVVQQPLLDKADVPDQIGWAFGMGLERIAMLLFEIPDIRLFWSNDERFLSQFRGVNLNAPLGETNLRRFIPFSKFPECKKDLSFWLPHFTTPSDPPQSAGSAAGGDAEKTGGGPWGDIHENDIMEIIREVGGDVVEDVKLFDEFVKKNDALPGGKQTSLSYKLIYRDLERTLTNAGINALHRKIGKALTERLGVKIR